MTTSDDLKEQLARKGMPAWYYKRIERMLPYKDRNGRQYDGYLNALCPDGKVRGIWFPYDGSDPCLWEFMSNYTFRETPLLRRRRF